MLHSITTEAEYVAMADGVKKARYVRGILAFLMPRLGSMSIGVYEDSQGATDLEQPPLSSSDSKHIGARHHFLRWLPVVKSPCSIFSQKISMRIS